MCFYSAIYYDCNIGHRNDVLCEPLGALCVRVHSHHYESEVVSVGVAVVCALDLYFVASHSTDLHLMDQPGDTQ